MQRTQASLAKEESYCDVDKAIVVISNHASDPATKVSGIWTAIGEDTTCKPAAWSVVLEGPKPGAGTYSGVEESYCSYTPEGGWDGIVYLDPVGGGDIRHLSMGSDYFLVNTRFAVDDPVDWGTATSPGNNNQTTIQADATAKRLVGDSNWVVPRTDGTVEAYHGHAEITCTTWDVLP